MHIAPKLIFIKNSLLTVLPVLLLCTPVSSFAWIYSEHRDIAMQAIQFLSAEHQKELNQLWQDSRTGYEKKLCVNPAELNQGTQAKCLDWAAFSAIAGDHSCSGKDMLETITTEDWLLNIAKVSAQLKSELAFIPVKEFANKRMLSGAESFAAQIHKQENRANRLNALRRADIQLLKTDPQYASRANSSTAHFLIARPSENTTNMEYAKLALQAGSEMNAMGVYAYYHIKALKKASRLANESQLTTVQRQNITRAMLTDEGFALHFLEDIFAAGHVAGTWGEVSQRMGTHNYYNENGLEVYTWKREAFSVVLMGDAHMRPQDMELAARAISISLQQVLDFAVARDTGYLQPYSALASADADNFNVCSETQLPAQKNINQYTPALSDAILPTPIPGLGTSLGSLPRFRSEVGLFVGLAGSLDTRVNEGGFFDFQDDNGTITGLDLSFRVGFGMDDIMDESGDGLVFISFGFRSDSASSNKFNDSSEATEAGSISAAIPARLSFTTRIRMPYYLIPTDLFWLSPLYLFNESAYTNMAVTAGNGGLIPWQNGIATSIGRFQFVLGREFGATFYGRDKSDQLIIPPDSPTDSIQLTQLESILFDIPVVEYRPYRSFSSNQSSSMVVQLYVSADVPQNNAPIIIQGVEQSMHTVWGVGIRLVFDWRHY
jgi:hypothetical protein